MSALDEDFNCPPNLSGPDCDIPFEQCPDGIRRCFNNSRCVKNSKRDMVTAQYGYSCDCSFAAEISQYAGHECEYSSTSSCPETSGFCTNGGVCGSYVHHLHVYHGCHCPIDFAGAHCQYLKALVDIRHIKGEALMPEIGDNFYGFTPSAKSGSTGEGIIIGFALCAAVVAAAVLFSSKTGVSLTRIGKGFNRLSLKSESKSELRKSEELELQTNAQVV